MVGGTADVGPELGSLSTCCTVIDPLSALRATSSPFHPPSHAVGSSNSVKSPTKHCLDVSVSLKLPTCSLTESEKRIFSLLPVTERGPVKE